LLCDSTCCSDPLCELGEERVLLRLTTQPQDPKLTRRTWEEGASALLWWLLTPPTTWVCVDRTVSMSQSYGTKILSATYILKRVLIFPLVQIIHR
jgi:hypothetical protein